MSRREPLEAGGPLLEVRELSVTYRSGRRVVAAVERVGFTVAAGETVGLVGESGSGKTTIGRAILGLAPVAGGSIALDGRDVTRLGGRARREMARDLRVVFQDPYGSLNPAMRAGEILAESAGRRDRARTLARARDLLDAVGLAARDLERYPAEFSGGQRQRLAIARALMSAPRLVVCDEPVSALDLSVQAQVLNLLRDLQAAFSFSYLFVGHNLEVVRYMAHRVLVLYRGRLMETGPADVVARRPRHPYTQALVAAAPDPDPAVQRARRAQRPAPVPDRDRVPAPGGCPFEPRCPFAVELCRTERPAPRPAGDGGTVACHRYPEIASHGSPSREDTHA